MPENSQPTIKEVNVHARWMEMQGIPIIRDFSIPSLKEVEVGTWERLGAAGAFVILDGAEESNDAYVLEIRPGGATNPEHHLYEEIVYVVSGRGATTIWNHQSGSCTFEWQEGSLFAIPMNTWHKFFNGDGNQPARFYVVSSAPLVMNLYHNLDFIFNCSNDFLDRFDGREDFFCGEGQTFSGLIWESNFIADVGTFPLLELKARGADGFSRIFEMADGSMVAHISEFPVGTYKKAHRHQPGANVIILEGQGYSLLWPEGEKLKKVDWRAGSVLVPPKMWFHQHFNTGTKPARYLAIRWGSKKYRMGLGLGSMSTTVALSTKEGGNQIEYQDEDPSIRELFKSELAKKG